jgi:hypothetical protein
MAEIGTDLITQFAKTVVEIESSIPRQELSQYATVKDYNGELYVQLDGSDQLTPIASKVAGIKDGDRVIVQIKNHSVAVTGNTSDPSTSSSEFTKFTSETFDRITADEGLINDVQAKNVVITNKLDAANASINELETNYVNVKNTLTANQADIDKLNTNKLDASAADLKYATIDNLNSANATINNLKAEKLDASAADLKYATIDNLNSANATINNLKAEKLDASAADLKYATIDNLNSANATINNLKAEKLDASAADLKYATINNLNAANATINNLKTEKLDASVATATYATIKNLDAVDAKVGTLNGDYATFKQTTTESLNADKASISALQTDKISTTDVAAKYATIDFGNIGTAAIENLYSKSGIIKDLVLSNGTVSGTLVGVTIKGDLIEGGTVVADKLVMKGTDGLYYKLNTTGETVSSEQTDENSLNGSVITAKSITAEKVNVNDLVAFDATIAGFHLTAGEIYSGAKAGADSSEKGIFLDSVNGQLAVGDGTNYLKYYKDQNGAYKLAISANSINIGINGTNVETAIADAKKAGTDASSALASYKKTNDLAVSNAQTSANDAQADISAYKTTVEETYASKTEFTAQMNLLQSTMTSNYSAFTDYRKSNDVEVSKAKSLANTAQSTIDVYKTSNNAAVADSKKAGTDALNALSSYKSSNDQAVSKAQTTATTAQSNLDSYKSATNQRLDELKNIADNAIESWYLKGAPSATNPPASTWTTDTLKKQHAGDLYMDTDTGYSYRWSGTEWVQVKDSDVTKALKEIESVKTTYATKSELKATDTELSGKVSDSLTTAKSYTDNSISTEVTNRNAAIKAQADSINLSVSKTYTKYETFSSYQTDADGRIATANANASTAVSTAKTAASDAATAKTNASTAVSTANDASTSAANAVKTANTASSTASSAVTTANAANTTAQAANTTAQTANATADTAKSTAEAAKDTADDAYSRTLRVQVSSTPADAAGDTSKLTATVWRGGELLSDETVAKMGLLAWYVGVKRVATGSTYTCAAGTATECRLEA